jgi:hypothetical protein
MTATSPATIFGLSIQAGVEYRAAGMSDPECGLTADIFG